jgi:quercetin dioxygenase-like cupin family protein
MKIVTMNLLCLALSALHSDCVQAENPQPLPHAFDAGWQGSKTCELLYETPTVRVGKCSFPPGIGHEKHYHNPHFGYVLAGATMLVQNADGESEVVTEAGNSWITTERTIHQAINIGSTTAAYLIVEPQTAGTANP